MIVESRGGAVQELDMLLENSETEVKIADANTASIWQVAAGPPDRPYPDVCLDWDMVCIGPGGRGPWPECREQLGKDGRSGVFNKIEKLHNEMEEGDIVVLRVGTANVALQEFVWVSGLRATPSG